MTAVVNASDQGHQSDLPVRIGIYVGDEGVVGSFKVGNGAEDGYRGYDKGVGDKRLCMWFGAGMLMFVLAPLE